MDEETAPEQEWKREQRIREAPVAATMDEVAWLAQRIEQRLQQPDYETYHSDPGIRAWVDDPNYTITQGNDRSYLDFLMRLLPSQAAIEAAHIEAQTSRKLVRWTMGLAVATIVLAMATIVLALDALGWSWPF